MRNVQQQTSLDAADLNAYFNGMDRGSIGAWMRRNSTTNGDYDIYLYNGSTLAAVSGLGQSVNTVAFDTLWVRWYNPYRSSVELSTPASDLRTGDTGL